MLSESDSFEVINTESLYIKLSQSNDLGTDLKENEKIKIPPFEKFELRLRRTRKQNCLRCRRALIEEKGDELCSRCSSIALK